MVHHGCRHEVICRFLQIGLSSRWGSIVADSSSVLDDELAMVAQALEGRSALLVDRQQEALAQFAEYRNVPRPDLDRSCARNVARVVAILRGESGLPPDVVEDERLSGERRARQGIPAEVVVAAYRAVIGVIRDDYLETGPALGEVTLRQQRVVAVQHHCDRLTQNRVAEELQALVRGQATVFVRVGAVRQRQLEQAGVDLQAEDLLQGRHRPVRQTGLLPDSRNSCSRIHCRSIGCSGICVRT